MNKLKKFLCFVVLIVSTCFLFVSCSCSFGSNRNGGNNGGGNEGEGGGGNTTPAPTVSYSVTVSFNDENGGGYISSTGEDVHLAGSSPVYTICPNENWAIENIKIDGGIYYSYDMDGYLFTNKEVQIASIDSDVSIVVKFVQLWFTVSASVEDSKYSYPEGAQIMAVDNPNGNNFLGGDSAEYLIDLQDGYIIHSVFVNGELYYMYEVGDSKAYSDMRVVIDAVYSNQVIEAKIYRKEDYSSLIKNIHYGKNAVGNTTEREFEGNSKLVSFEVLGFDDITSIPTGIPATLSFDSLPYTYITRYALSFDGGLNFDVSFDAGSDYEGAGFIYDAEAGDISFDIFDKSVIIKAYTKGEQVDLILYNGSYATEPIKIEAYSYYILQDWLLDFDWFYSIASSYEQANTHRTLTIVETDDNGSVKHSVYINPSIINEANNRVVLIYLSK